MRITKSAALASSLALGIALVVFPAAGHADSITYLQTSDHCTGLCGTTVNNTVSLTTDGQAANTVLVTVTLGTGWFFINTGASDKAFTWALPNSSGVTVGGTFGSGFTAASLGSGTLQSDGLTFQNTGYGIDTTQTPNGAAGTGNTLSFTITAAGLTLNSFLTAFSGANPTTALFAADVFSPKTGCTGPGTTCTGIIDFGPSVSQVPLPPAALLFGTALFGMGLLGRRRKKGFVGA